MIKNMRVHLPTAQLPFLFILVLFITALAPLTRLTAAEGAPDKKSQTPTPPEKKSDPPQQNPPPKKLTGAELYSIHCNRCHPERYPTERTAAQWKTILLHMRVRANLPAEQARTILKYLQDNSGR
jgi:hypothetical protein